MREKGQTGHIASLDISKWKNHIEFPGIPEKLRLMFIEDLIQSLESGKSKLLLDEILQIHH